MSSRTLRKLLMIFTVDILWRQNHQIMRSHRQNASNEKQTQIDSHQLKLKKVKENRTSIYSDANVARWREKVMLRSCSQLNQSRELYLIETSALTVLFIYLRQLLLYLLLMLLVLVNLHSYDLLYAGSWHSERFFKIYISCNRCWNIKFNTLFNNLSYEKTLLTLTKVLIVYLNSFFFIKQNHDILYHKSHFEQHFTH